jgi:hypothetical protein
MKKSMLSLLTGAALLGSVGVASAAEPMVLTNAAMDKVTAGVRQEGVSVAANSCSRGAVCQAASQVANVNRGNGGGPITVTQVIIQVSAGRDINL